MITAGGIAACFVTSVFGIYIYKVNNFSKIQKSLNLQLFLSTLFTVGTTVGAMYILPEKWINE